MPHLYKDDEETGLNNDNLQKECIENLRRKTRAELKKTTDVKQKMKLDHNLRMSYKYGRHDQLSFGQKTKQKKNEQASKQPLRLCKACSGYI